VRRPLKAWLPCLARILGPPVGGPVFISAIYCLLSYRPLPLPTAFSNPPFFLMSPCRCPGNEPAPSTIAPSQCRFRAVLSFSVYSSAIVAHATRHGVPGLRWSTLASRILISKIPTASACTVLRRVFHFFPFVIPRTMDRVRALRDAEYSLAIVKRDTTD
jgi:hypothetical protein